MTDSPQLAELRRQLAEAEATASRPYSSMGTGGAWSNPALSGAEHSAASSRAAELRRQIAALTPAGPRQLTAQEQQDRALADTEGRGQATLDDPYSLAALDHLRGSMDRGPFTDSVVNNLLSQQADARNASMADRLSNIRDSLAARGADASDPAYASYLNEQISRNQQQANAALGAMQTNATINNYNAQNAAASSLAAARAQQLAEANNQFNQGGQIRLQINTNGQHFNGFGGFGGTRPQTMPQFQYRPPTVAPAQGQQQQQQQPAQSQQQPAQQRQPSNNDGMGTWDDGSPYSSSGQTSGGQDNWNYENNPWPSARPPEPEVDYGNYGKLTMPNQTQSIAKNIGRTWYKFS